MKTIKTILALLLYCTACTGQNNTNQINMDNIKTQSLSILEKTGEKTTYLTGLTRLVQKASDELNTYAGGDELFLRYEAWTIPKNDESSGIRERAILHCIPERLETQDGGNHDTYICETLIEVLEFYKNGKPDGHAELPGEWSWIGEYVRSGIHEKILHYYFNNESIIHVQQEDLGKYDKYNAQ